MSVSSNRALNTNCQRQVIDIGDIIKLSRRMCEFIDHIWLSNVIIFLDIAKLDYYYTGNLYKIGVDFIYSFAIPNYCN
jgi:hypothetical protein